MNHYIYAQILNMQAMAKTFGQSCELAAMKDDGQISKDEVKQLKRIKAAVEAFCKELDKLIEAGSLSLNPEDDIPDHIFQMVMVNAGAAAHEENQVPEGTVLQ